MWIKYFKNANQNRFLSAEGAPRDCCPSPFLPSPALTFIYHTWCRLGEDRASIFISASSRMLIIGFWENKEHNRSMPLSQAALRRQMWCSCCTDGLRSTEAGLHLGLWQTSQRALRALPSKEHSQGRSYKFSKDTKLRVVFTDLKNEADVNRTFKSDLTQWQHFCFGMALTAPAVR